MGTQSAASQNGRTTTRHSGVMDTLQPNAPRPGYVDPSAWQGGAQMGTVAPAVNGISNVSLTRGPVQAGPVQTGVANPTVRATYGTDFSEDRQRVEDALMQRMNPQIERDRENMRAQMANSGITLGSDAHGAATDNFNRGVADARLGALLAGGQEQSRLAGLEQARAQFENQAIGQQFGQNIGAGQFANTAQQQAFDQNFQNAGFSNQNALAEAGFNNANAQTAYQSQMQRAAFEDARRQQALQEQFALRNQPINEITALLSGSQVAAPNFNQFQPQAFPVTDVAGNIWQNYQGQMNNYNQQMGARNSLLGNLFGALPAFL